MSKLSTNSSNSLVHREFSVALAKIRAYEKEKEKCAPLIGFVRATISTKMSALTPTERMSCDQFVDKFFDGLVEMMAHVDINDDPQASKLNVIIFTN